MVCSTLMCLNPQCSGTAVLLILCGDYVLFIGALLNTEYIAIFHHHHHHCVFARMQLKQFTYNITMRASQKGSMRTQSQLPSIPTIIGMLKSSKRGKVNVICSYSFQMSVTLSIKNDVLALQEQWCMNILQDALWQVIT